MATESITRPTFRSVPQFIRTNGDIAAHVGEMVELPPDANQRDILDVIYAESRPGRLACFEVAAIAPRQNIKSSTLEVAAITDLIVLRKPLNIWTAHLYKTTRGAFRDMVNRIDGCDALRKKCRKPFTGTGNESIELLTGERIEFHARSKGGGRGLTGDTVTLDEALLLAPEHMGALLPTMATRINGQVRYGSSAGLAASEVLRGVRDRGRAGNDPALGYLEWCAPFTECAQRNCTHLYGQVQGCALDDERLWALANPSLGDRLPLDTLRKLRASMPAGEFAREFLGWWDDPALEGVAIPPVRWAACGDLVSPVASGLVMAVSLTPDRSTASLVAAGRRSDGLVTVETVLHGPFGDWFAPKVKETARRHGADVVLHPGHQAGTLVNDLSGITLRTVTTGEYAQACGVFFDLAMDGRLRYPAPQPELTDAVSKATCKPSGETWRWAGEGISALVAGSMAVWAVANPTRNGWMVSL